MYRINTDKLRHSLLRHQNKSWVRTMTIQAIGLKNFTVFEDFRIDVSSGINVFIGENGTGKTHLLKVLYAACEISKGGSSGAEFLKKCFKKKVALELFRNAQRRELDIYLKANCKNKEIIVCESSFPVVRIVHNGKLDEGNKFSEDKPESKDESYQIHLQEDVIFDATFIPCKDMLTHADGFLAMANKYRDFPFDKTLTDIVIKASQWKMKQPPKLAMDILPILEEMMDGIVVFENDEFYIKKNNGQLILFELEAEGLKKVGLLWQLLMTDNLNEDSILIWDEPEANLNPKFLSKIVECLLELSRHGVQIFLSTHNYIFAKYFDVAKKDNDRVLFHSLYFEEKTEGVKCETQPYFENLKHNDISAAFNHLLERVYQIQIGD